MTQKTHAKRAIVRHRIAGVEIKAVFLPCPFCGGTDLEIFQSFNEIEEWKAVECRKCNATGRVTQWNKRDN